MEIGEKIDAIFENTLDDFKEIGLKGAVITYNIDESKIHFQHSIPKEMLIDMMKKIIESLEAEES